MGNNNDYHGRAGWVYIARCESMKEGVLKIGATTNDPNLRAKQLTASTSSPTQFTILYSRQTPNCTETERAMHQALADKRLNQKREFFNVSLYEASRTLDSLCGPLDFADMTYADFYATLEDRGDGVLNEQEIALLREFERKKTESNKLKRTIELRKRTGCPFLTEDDFAEKPKKRKQSLREFFSELIDILFGDTPNNKHPN